MSIAASEKSEWPMRVVDSLVASGELSPIDAEQAIVEADRQGIAVTSFLSSTGVVDPRATMRCLAAISGVPTVDIETDPPDPEALAKVPLHLAQQFGVVGLRLNEGKLILASTEPLGVEQLRTITAMLDCEVGGCVLAAPAEIGRLVSVPEKSVVSEILGGPADLAIGAPDGTGHLVRQVREVFNPRTAEESPWSGSPGPSERPVLTRGAEIDELLRFAVERGASDLHLSEGFPPAIRLDGSIRPVESLPRLDREELRRMVFAILPQAMREKFEATKELDASYEVHGLGRFRVNVFQQQGAVGAVLRAIPTEVPTLETLGLPKIVGSFAELRRGLVLVTGPTGSGKSTTLAAIVDRINRTKPLHIMTVEDPIEFVHTHNRSIVNQREIGVDTMSFAEGLRHVLRQDPDVILVGEMRDLETMSTALTAAETGHLVFATLHTQDAPQTIDRIIDAFPTGQQGQIRMQLASCLEAVVTQQLVLGSAGSGRVPVLEVMICTSGVRNLIRSGKTHQVYSLMQTGREIGMQTMDQGLAKAVEAGEISESMALDRAHDSTELLGYLRA